jgi:putative acetyltransferase
VREVHARAFGDGEGVPALVDALRAAQTSLALRYPPGAFQVAKLSSYEEWMTGTFVYSDTFWDLDCVGLRGERLETA